MHIKPLTLIVIVSVQFLIQDIIHVYALGVADDGLN